MTYLVNTDTGKKNIFQVIKTDTFVNIEEIEKPVSKKNYVIAFTGRSGSSMLCSILKKTKSMGMPEEFTNPRGPMQMYLKNHPVQDVVQYFEVLRRIYTTPNQVFGMKTAYVDFEPLVDEGLVRTCLDPVKFIYLKRDDVIGQAISYVKAKQTNLWHREKDRERQRFQKEGEWRYDEEAIFRQIDVIMERRKKWEYFFFALFSGSP